MNSTTILTRIAIPDDCQGPRINIKIDPKFRKDRKRNILALTIFFWMPDGEKLLRISNFLGIDSVCKILV